MCNATYIIYYKPALNITWTEYLINYATSNNVNVVLQLISSV